MEQRYNRRKFTSHYKGFKYLNEQPTQSLQVKKIIKWLILFFLILLVVVLFNEVPIIQDILVNVLAAVLAHCIISITNKPAGAVPEQPNSPGYANDDNDSIKTLLQNQPVNKRQEGKSLYR